MKVYLAGSSADIARAKHWHQRLVEAGIEVTSTWIANVEKVGEANPRDANHVQRSFWSGDCVHQVMSAGVLWLLAPPIDRPTRGAWIEFGIAMAVGVRVVCSGDTKQSIFCALAEEHATDEDAFVAIVELAKVSP